MRIVRGPDPGPVTEYRDYKPHLQPLFRSRCAYCISHEDVMGRYDAMQVDHFRPLKGHKFKHLKREWTNLYYTCGRCNLHKSNHWPTPEQAARGLRFVDPCEDDPDDHIRIVGIFENGGGFRLRHLTPAGRYTIDKIGLDRKQLRDIRLHLAQQGHEARKELDEKRQQIEGLTNEMDERGSTPNLEEVLRSLEEEQQRILRRIEELHSRRPFLIDEPAA